MPKLSFIIPTYNASSTLPRLLRTLLGQEEADCEFLFGVEPSNDNSLIYLKEEEKRDSRIKVYENKTRLGPLMTRLSLIKEAKGDFIAFADSDDYIDCSFSKRMLSYFDKDVDAVCSSFYIERYGKRKKYPFSTRRVKELSRKQACKKLLMDISVRGFLVNKVFRKELFFSSSLLLLRGKGPFEDFPLVYSLFSKCKKVVLLPFPLYIYVKEGESMTSSLSINRAKRHLDSFALVKWGSIKLGEEYHKDFLSSYFRIKTSLAYDLSLSKKAGLTKEEEKEIKRKLRLLKEKDFSSLGEFSDSIFPLEHI